MPAVVPAPTGTWTVIDFTKAGITGAQPVDELRMEDINFSGSLKDADFDELRQFVQWVALGYSIPFNVALVLCDNALQIMRSRGGITRAVGF